MSVAQPYYKYQPELLPPWMQDETGIPLAQAFGMVKDGMCEAAMQAVRARCIRTAPNDALDYAGQERSLPRMPGDTPASYLARLLAAWDLWSQAGTEQSIKTALGWLGLTNFKIFGQTNTTGQRCTDGDWNWDGDSANWARAWVVIYPPHPWVTDGTWSSPGIWGDGGTIGSDASEQEVALIRYSVNAWRPAHVAVGIIVVMDVTAFNAALPNGTWNLWRNRNPHALYLQG